MLEVLDISKRYGELVALDATSFALVPGETVALIGPSGSGKTTLLHMLAGTLQPDTGEVLIEGRALTSVASRRERARLVGMMYQQHDLVPNLSVVHNVLAGRLGEWGLLRSIVSLASPRETHLAQAALDRVGIAAKLYERTSRLSGGEQQRVALARLLVQNPRVILADEPVSSVDPARARDLIELLAGIARDEGRALVVSLHSASLALGFFDRVIALSAGKVVFDRPTSNVRELDLTDLYALDSASPPSVMDAAG